MTASQVKAARRRLRGRKKPVKSKPKAKRK